MKFLQKPGVLSCLPVAHKKIVVANRMKSMREELRKISKDFRDFKFSEGRTCTSLEQHDDDRETSSRLPEEPIIGRNREKQEIINLLSAGTNNDETVIVSIHGLGGMGKSTLAQLIYNDAQFKKYDHRIWVYVSRDFSLKKIGSSIISLIPIEGGQQNRDTLEAINQCLDNLLRGKKVLIVLDDLWEEKDNELGKLRSMLQVGKKGTTIDVIVTTRKEDIARKVSTCTPYKLQPLNDNTCWEIIKRYSRFEDQHYQERLEKIGLDIAKKCGESGWWSPQRCLPFVVASMCIGRAPLPCSATHHGETSGDHMERYTMHDLVHDLATLIMGDELIVSNVASKNNKTNSQKYCRYASVTKYDNTTKLSNVLPSKVRALHFSDSSKLDLSCGAFSFAKCLRILDFSGCSGILLPASIGKLKQLKYLTASQMQNDVLPEFMTELSKLQYLNLNGSSHISALPESMGKLWCLKYLGLSGCSGISKLPGSFGDLKCMMHLDMSGCSGIRELPDSLGNLTNLHHLDLSECSGVKEIPESLCGLTHLQYLNLSFCRYIGRLAEAIGSLHLDLSMNRFEYLPESIGNLKRLHTLNLMNCWFLKSLPESIGCATGLKLFHHFRALQKLHFFGCQNLESLPEGIQQLSSLQTLRLAKCHSISTLPEWLSDISSLKSLVIEGFDSIKSLPACIQHLTNLEELVIEGNQELQQWCKSEENKAKLAHINIVSSRPSHLFF
uniref:Uncharacterized protein n=1 Tax=Setaria italica TaxID=4555 RepID=K3ZHH4_SETIT